MRAAIDKIHRGTVIGLMLVLVLVIIGAILIPILDADRASGDVIIKAGFELPATMEIINVECPNAAEFPTVALPSGNWILSARSTANDQALRNRYATVTLDGSNPDSLDLIVHMGRWRPVYIPVNCPVKCYSSDGKGIVQAVRYAMAR